MHGVDISDETYVGVAPAALAPLLSAPDLLAQWFPLLRFEVFMDRAEKGTRWSVSGDLDGSMEVWLEPMGAGTLVHWYVRAEPGAGGRSVRSGRRRDPIARYVDVLNARMFEFKDEAETRLRAP